MSSLVTRWLTLTVSSLVSVSATPVIVKVLGVLHVEDVKTRERITSVGVCG